jgi:transcriptional regulator with XRE-family HTH domain
MDFDIAASRSPQPSGPAPVGSIDVGARIAQLRADRGWTLQQAAAHTGVAFSTLSKIERHELSPTVTTLTKIAHGMDLSLSQLLESPRQRAGMARRSLSRAGEAKGTATGSCDNAVLCSDLKNRRMTPIRTRVRARDLSAYEEWARYEAEIFLMVLEGTLVIHSQSYEPTRLEAGDSIYYDASTGHLWTSEGEGDAVVLWVYAE